MTGGQFDALDAIMILDQQFAAVVILGRFEEDGDRQVAADAEIAAALEADGVVDMRVERLTRPVTVEQRRIDFEWERRGEEDRRAA